MRLTIPTSLAACCLLGACVTENDGGLDPDRCAASLRLPPARLLAGFGAQIYRLGRYGDSLFWRVDSTAFAWHDGQIDSFPQEYDDGFQIPSAPYYWVWGTFRTLKVCHWDGTRTVVWDHAPGDMEDLRFEGNRATWTEFQGLSTRIWTWEGAGEPVLLQSRHANASGLRYTDRGAVWMESDGGSTKYWERLEDGVVHETPIEVGDGSKFVMTDSLLAWIQDDRVMVYRDGETRTVSDQVDFNTYLMARGSRIAWSMDNAAQKPVIWLYDAGNVRKVKEYAAQNLVREVLFNRSGMLMRVWDGETRLQEDWFDGKTIRSLGNIGPQEAILAERHAYGWTEYGPFDEEGPCAIKDRNATYILGSDL